MNMKNIPQITLGLVAVSRDCFPKSLSENRRRRVADAYRALGKDLYECPIVVENEEDMLRAAADVEQAGVDALVVYLGNFGPETSETLFVRYFNGPVMFAAATEETGEDLLDGRGDAYCGMLNASYNMQLRNLKAYIPKHPVGDETEVSRMMGQFLPVARAIIGLRNLKIISFGPRPQDFLACNAPIKQLFNLGVEIQENSELDLFHAYKTHEGDERIPTVVADMKEELGAEDHTSEALLRKFAQYELTLLDWAEQNKGSRRYVVFANKCWPTFQHEFGFVPCYVNSRLSAQGYPVGCEVDIYGALSEYIGQCVSDDIVTLLDINNTVPRDMYEASIRDLYAYSSTDVFMGFHCGNTCTKKLADKRLSYHRIMCRTAGMETSTGTMNGNILPGDVTFYRLQSTADNQLKAYVAQGEVLPVDCRSFGGIGVIGINEMERFYRNVLVENGFPHHGAVVFGHYGKALFDVFRYLGVTDIGFNRPRHILYPTENPYD